MPITCMQHTAGCTAWLPQPGKDSHQFYPPPYIYHTLPLHLYVSMPLMRVGTAGINIVHRMGVGTAAGVHA